MRLPRAHDGHHLLQMLGQAMRKETDQMTLNSSSRISSKTGSVSPKDFNATLNWLYQLNQKFGFYSETFFLSVSVLDRFLTMVKAQPKHLKCIGVACFYLAAKTLEEDEVVPGTLELVRESQCGCSVAEVLRMERVVLNKLEWNVHLVTPLQFLHIFHALLMSNVPKLLDRLPCLTPSQHLSLLTAKLEVCACQEDLLAFSPSTLALSLLSLELQLFASDWFTITHMMQKTIQIPDEDLIRCRELASHYLSLDIHGYLRRGLDNLITKPTKPTKRKVEEAEDEDDVYEGIKRLYNEDLSESANAVTSVSMTSCGEQARQDDSQSVTALPTQAAAV